MSLDSRIVSKSFKDISFSFVPHPVTNDMTVLRNEDAIKTAIKNCVFTIPGEKYFNENFGSPIRNSLFDLIDDATASIVSDRIIDTIETYEPRVTNVSVEVEALPDDNAFNIVIFYDIIGEQFPRQDLEFILEATR